MDLFEPRNETTASNGGYLKDKDWTIPEITTTIRSSFTYLRLATKVKRELNATAIKDHLCNRYSNELKLNKTRKTIELKGWRLKPLPPTPEPEPDKPTYVDLSHSINKVFPKKNKITP